MMNLADPELELIDPTPNVHSMFLHFDKTFFWAKLASRCVVRWSKRMYSCAGICSYEGRGGLCDIALSEPLLKLRPRKDLVETLLHEMIHAYLFVASRDRDRNGHGPIFQSHMHRINRAAGLNISIYHDFHDEVKLYQTHWWRCDGPCQLQKPYFGIVRRSCNRAPGPTDYWWDSHKRRCGGTFTKIKEPEESKKNGRKTVGRPNADITKFIINKNDNDDSNNKKTNQNNKPTKPILQDVSNVTVKANVGVKSNRSSTLVITKNNVVYNPKPPQPKPIFIGTPHKISTEKPNNSNCEKSDLTDVLKTVRNIWASKHIGANGNRDVSNKNKTSPTPVKHKADTHAASPPAKIKKIDDYFNSAASSMLKDLYGQDFNLKLSKDEQKIRAVPKKMVDCPICNSKIDDKEINRHLDECLNKDVIEMLSKDIIPAASEPYIDAYQSDPNKLVEINYKEGSNPLMKDTGFKTNKDLQSVKVKDEQQNQSKKSFDTSNLEITESVINSNGRKVHTIIDQNTVKEIPNIVVDSIKSEPSSCTKLIPETACPCCGDKLNKSVDEHLEECLSFFDNNSTIPEEGASTSFSNQVIVIDDEDELNESLKFNATGTKLPCPCCLKMVEEINMNEHLDECLS